MPFRRVMKDVGMNFLYSSWKKESCTSDIRKKIRTGITSLISQYTDSANIYELEHINGGNFTHSPCNRQKHTLHLYLAAKSTQMYSNPESQVEYIHNRWHKHERKVLLHASQSLRKKRINLEADITENGTKNEHLSCPYIFLSLFLTT